MDENNSAYPNDLPQEPKASNTPESEEKTVPAPTAVFSPKDWLALGCGILLAVLWFQVFGLNSLIRGIPGIGVFLFAAGSVASAVIFLGRHTVWNRESVFILVFTLLLALSCGVFADTILRMLNIVLLSFFIPACVFSLSGRGFSWSSPRVIPDTIRLFFAGLFRHVPKPFRAAGRLFHSERTSAAGILFGIIVSIPILTIVIWLLSSADTVFSSLLSGISQFFEQLKLGNVLLNIIKTAVMGLMLFSLIYSLAQPARERPKPGEKLKITMVSPFAIVLGLLDAVYIVFAVIQFVFLFGGAETAAMQGGYAQYARRGFFQLLAVAAINLSAVLICVGAANAQKGRSVKILSLVLVGLTAVILVSAVFRMCLYISVYGMSLLRMMTLFGMAYIALLLIAAAYKTLNPDFRFWPVLFAVGLAGWTAFNFINPDRIIAEYNVSAYLDGELENIDVIYLTGLGADTIPALERLRNSTEDAELSEYLEDCINGIRTSDDDLPWHSWTLASLR
ncbi:MAG: DUF4153 domain-containing protein [Oscillospiraceae bacterium]